MEISHTIGIIRQWENIIILITRATGAGGMIRYVTTRIMDREHRGQSLSMTADITWSSREYAMISHTEHFRCLQVETDSGRYKIACEKGGSCDRENVCMLEFDDDTSCGLSAKQWNEVLAEGLRRCGYLNGKHIRNVSVFQCEC